MIVILALRLSVFGYFCAIFWQELSTFILMWRKSQVGRQLTEISKQLVGLLEPLVERQYKNRSEIIANPTTSNLF
jgi:hypothetical protein